MRASWLLLLPLALALPARGQDTEVVGRWDSGTGMALELAAGPAVNGAPTVIGAVTASGRRSRCELTRREDGVWAGGSDVGGDFVNLWLRREGETLVLLPMEDVVLHRVVDPAPVTRAAPAASTAPAPAAPRGSRSVLWGGLGILAVGGIAAGGAALALRRREG